MVKFYVPTWSLFAGPVTYIIYIIYIIYMQPVLHKITMIKVIYIIIVDDPGLM